MAFMLQWTQEAFDNYQSIKNDKSRKGLLKQLEKTLRFLANDPRHPSLNTHAYSSLIHPYDRAQKVFEAYVQNNTPAAYRIFWCYGPESNEITLIAITSHP